MSGDRIPLSAAQFSALRRGAQEREEAIIRSVLQQPEYPPLPACPDCGVAPAAIDSMVEPPTFDVHDTAILINFTPCGHRFRAVLALDDLEGWQP